MLLVRHSLPYYIAVETSSKYTGGLSYLADIPDSFSQNTWNNTTKRQVSIRHKDYISQSVT